MPNNGFSTFPIQHGLLADRRNTPYPTTLSAWNNAPLQLSDQATHYGYVFSGTPTLRLSQGNFVLQTGMYFSVAQEATLEGMGEGVVISREGYKGFFHLGGPIEEKGRLRYIDGCTDSLLIPPVLRGDACFNLLYFPPSIQQTTHTHPSIRAGIVARGRGICKTPQGDISLVAGMIFLLDPDAPHGFWTEQDSMTVIAYHPDSDFGPQHDDHPMLNRTIVDGTSARYRPDIQTLSDTERPS